MKLISEIISSVRRNEAIPDTSPQGYQDSDFIVWIQDALNDEVYPSIVSMVEEFFVVKQELALQSNSVNIYANATIPLPGRTFTGQLRELKYKDTGNDLWNIPLVNLEDDDIDLQRSRTSAYNRMVCFYIENDAIHLAPSDANLAGSLVLKYVVKPPTTLSTSTTLCSDIAKAVYSSGTSTFTTTGTITDLTTYCAISSSKLFDIFRKSTGALVAVDVLMTHASSGVFTTTTLSQDSFNEIKAYQKGGFNGTLGAVTTGYSADLVLCPAGQNTRTPLPEAADQLLIQKVAAKYLHSIGDTEGLAVNLAGQENISKQLIKVLGQRVTGESKKIVNRSGILRSILRR